MKLLFITAFNPSKNDAGSNYTRQLVLELTKQYRIDLIIFKKKAEKLFLIETPNLKIINTYNVNTLTRIIGMLSLPIFFPLFSSRFKWTVALFLKQLLKKQTYDLIYFDFSQTFAYSLFIKHPQKLFMAHDVIYQRYLRRKNLFIRWVKWSEQYLLGKANSIFTFSNKDCNLINNLYHIKSQSTSFFLQEEALKATPTSNNKSYFIFYGNWHRADNFESLKWFIDNVLTLLDPSFEFKIIGNGLPSEIAYQLKKYHNNVEYLGYIDNPYPIIANANALISPLTNGAGVKVKVIEAFTCGTPVIGTALSFEGIDSQFNEFAIIAHSPAEFKQKIESLDISLSNKIAFKTKFISMYNNKQILNYINQYSKLYNGDNMD